MEGSLLTGLLLLFVILAIVGLAVTRRQNVGSTRAPRQPKGASKANGASGAKERASNPAQIVEDVKLTQTSRVVDAIQILDDLDQASPGYRHYCELVGRAQSEGGVEAPYSHRQVAYYDLRCYRIEVRGGQDVETLVAHERSIDPFYFRDSSGDEKVFVDLESFGENCILVNATNRVEGPNSDFSKKFSSAVGAASQSAATGVPGVMAAVRLAQGRLRVAVAQACARKADDVRGVLRKARTAFGSGLEPAYAGAALCGGMRPAYAGAGGLASAYGHGVRDGVATPAAHVRRGANMQFAGPGGPGGGPGGPGGPRGGGPRGGGPGGPRPGGARPPRGGRGGAGMPQDLSSFLGPSRGGQRLGGPYYRGGGSGDAAEVLLGAGLGALIGSLATSSSTGGQSPTDVSSISSFRGYRIIEDIVPLNSPVYALGEIYRNGPDVFIGRSVSASYPSSYFATKPEAEVIAALS